MIPDGLFGSKATLHMTTEQQPMVKHGGGSVMLFCGGT